MKELIKQKIDEIAECIFKKIENTEEEIESFGLYSGEFGILLFLFFYSRYSKNEKHRLITEDYAERLFYRFLNETKRHTFCDGLSGILYLFEFLREHDFIDMDISDSQPLLDNYLIARMRHNIQQSYYDFMHGALGVGLYFLKKGTNPECIRELIDYLYQTAEKDTGAQIFKWESIIDYEKNRIGYNLSLSHGISSIIIFLSRVVNSGEKNTRVLEMLSGSVNYVLSHQKDFMQFGYYFPHYIITNFQEPVIKSRLAWCYGDLGIGMALWQAGKTFDNSGWKEMGLKVLIQSTHRQNYDETLISEAGICHGSAGLAMIYRRKYIETGRDEFKTVAYFWLSQTLKFSQFEDGLAGYKSFMKNEWKWAYSLLTGIAGIGLVLLSCMEDNKQIWDEMFLLS